MIIAATITAIVAAGLYRAYRWHKGAPERRAKEQAHYELIVAKVEAEKAARLAELAARNPEAFKRVTDEIAMERQRHLIANEEREIRLLMGLAVTL